MQRKFWNKTNIFGIAGVLAYAVTTLVLFIPFKGEPSMSLVNWQSPLGIIVIVLFIISLILYAWGTFKHEKELSYRDKTALIEQRNTYLPQLENNISERIVLANKLREKAIHLPLREYFSRYLKHTMPYIVTRKIPQKPLVITNALFRKGFVWDNIYYDSLKENDSRYRQLMAEYESYYSRIDDNKLKQMLGILWRFEHIAGSEHIFTRISVNNYKIPTVPMFIRGGVKGAKISQNTFHNQHKNVQKRILELKNGEDL